MHLYKFVQICLSCQCLFGNVFESFLNVVFVFVLHEKVRNKLIMELLSNKEYVLGISKITLWLFLPDSIDQLFLS